MTSNRSGTTGLSAERSTGPLSLLLFTSEPLVEGYGSATALRTFLDAAAAHTDWRITVVAPRSPAHRRYLQGPQLAVHTVPVGARSGRRRTLLQYAIGSRVGVTGPVDAVLSWQPMPAGLTGARAARKHGVPHIVRTCGPELARSWSRYPLASMAVQPLTRRLLRTADAVVVKSELEFALVERIAARRANRIVNAVGPQFGASPAAGGADHIRLLAVCQLEPHKRVGTLLAALRRIESRGWRLTVVGDGSQRRRLSDLAQVARLPVDFVGRQPHHRLPGIYAAHDALILASTMEGCANAALEAMAAGLPVIGHRAAVEDLVVDDVTGILTPSPDASGLATALERFLRPDLDRTAMRGAARRRAAAHTPARLVIEYADLFRSVGVRASYPAGTAGG